MMYEDEESYDSEARIYRAACKGELSQSNADLAKLLMTQYDKRMAAAGEQ